MYSYEFSLSFKSKNNRIRKLNLNWRQRGIQLDVSRDFIYVLSCWLWTEWPHGFGSRVKPDHQAHQATRYCIACFNVQTWILNCTMNYCLQLIWAYYLCVCVVARGERDGARFPREICNLCVEEWPQSAQLRQLHIVAENSNK